MSTTYTYRHVACVGFRADFTDQRRARNLGEVLDLLHGEALIVSVLALVEALVQHNAGLLDALSLRQRLIRSRAEQETIPQLLGDLSECSIAALVVLVKVPNQHNLVRRLELLERLAGAEQRDCGHALLGHVRDNGLRLAWALVGGDIVRAAEDLESGVALDAILLAEILLLGAVDFGEGDLLVFERRGGFFVLGGEGFAVAAPGCEDWEALR